MTKGGVEVQALNDVDFSIAEGEMVAVMGTSGCGKTTLLNVISGIDFADSGEIVIDRINLSAISWREMGEFRRNHIGIIFQNFNLLDSLNAEENIMVPLMLNELDYDLAYARIEEIAKDIGIEDILKKRIYELSGGQQQRVAICRAIVNHPRFLLADEPTGNLDSLSSGKVMECLTKINREKGMTILMVTHDQQIANYCQRVIVMEDGRVRYILNNDDDLYRQLAEISRGQQINYGQ